MWDVLKEYPAARVRLEAIAVKRLEKYKRAPLEKGEFIEFITYLLAFPFMHLYTRARARTYARNNHYIF